MFRTYFTFRLAVNCSFLCMCYMVTLIRINAYFDLNNLNKYEWIWYYRIFNYCSKCYCNFTAALFRANVLYLKLTKLTKFIIIDKWVFFNNESILKIKSMEYVFILYLATGLPFVNIMDYCICTHNRLLLIS